jgi:mevalonate kinase
VTTPGRRPEPASQPSGAAAPFPSVVIASTPGKLILMGEHAAVYGRPALVAAVDLRLRARFTRLASSRGGVVLDLAGLGVRRELLWTEIADYARAARQAWDDYARHPDAATFRRLWGTDPAHLVEIALGEAAAALGEATPPDLELVVASQLPIGSGFGSSAAAAVALVAGFCAWRGQRLDGTAIERLALEVERRQHGLPSGIDTATSLYGGLLWAQRSADGALAVERLAAHSPFLRRLQVFDTGTPAEPTGAVVAAVRERVARDPQAFEQRFDRMAALTFALREQLERAEENPAEIVALMREHQACLEELGVVPAAVRSLVRAIEAAGGAAKISGAGALTGTAGGTLLVYHARPESLDGWEPLRPLRRHRVTLGAPGFHLEEAV